jgi:sulfur carrier protein
MEISVNGELQRLVGGTTVAMLLDGMGLAGRRVAVEVNEAIVPRSEHERHVLRPGDRVEVVRAIGGG